MRSLGGGAKRHFDVTSVDPSEYEPQVVELSEQLIQDSTEVEGSHCCGETAAGREKEKPSSDRSVDTLSKTDESRSPVATKNARWLSKLQKLRQQFTTPPTD